MIDFPADWARYFGVDQVTAYPPGGGVCFRYQARLRPQPAFTGVIEMALARDPEFRVRDVGEPLRTVTAEGEYGAWVAIRGRRGLMPAAHFVGATFLGDFAAALDCLVTDGARFAACEQLSRELLHDEWFGMSGRPRHFHYAPPPGWQGVPAGLGVTWYPLDFPRNLTTIVVEPATRFETGDEAEMTFALLRASADLEVETQDSGELVARSGVRGRTLAVSGRPAAGRDLIHRQLAVFTVASHVYRMRLESTRTELLGEMTKIFHAVAASFHPLPGPHERQIGRAFSRPDALDQDHWAT